MKKLMNYLLAVMALWTITAQKMEAQQTFTISGHISAAIGTQVQATGSNGITYTANTISGGTYALEVPAGLDYTIRPYNNFDFNNGVTSIDPISIYAHVENVTPFTTPQQLIAADVNNDHVIDEMDVITVNQLVLSLISQFPNQTSWRFMPRNHTFPNPLQPFEFPDSIVVQQINANTPGIDFDGVKIGDVNFSVDLNYNSALATYYGYARKDENTNCQADSSEQRLQGWIVQATLGNQQYHTLTDTAGFFALKLPPNTVGVLRLLTPNGLWDTCAAISIAPSVGGLVRHDLSSMPIVDCPHMEVQLSTPFLRRCFDSYYKVDYCNKGTVLAENAYIDIQLDSLLDFVSSNQSYTLLFNGTDSIYRFEIGDVPIGACGSFKITVKPDCSAPLGWTHCSQAFIFPDTMCLPGAAVYSNLEIEGFCEGEYVLFTITNTGDDMLSPVNYVVIEDILIQMMGNNIQLASGESTVLTFPANGSIWRLEVEQPENHPFSQWVSAAVQGCGLNSNDSVSLGFVTTFPQYPVAQNMDEDCTENIGAFDPNDKQGFPKGVGDEHEITKDYPLEYLIRFQNTGTDTAFNVYILDTLSSTLDLSTFRFLSSSHPCGVFMDGPRLHFNFAQIMLPDSNINEPLSHGYVRFSVAPKSDLAEGAVITNEASIYFDFNDPVVTNQTLHTIRKSLVWIPELAIRNRDLSIKVFPLPAASEVSVRINDPMHQNGIILVYDQWGRQAMVQSFNSNNFRMDMSRLAIGAYYFRLVTDTGKVGAGRIVIAR